VDADAKILTGAPGNSKQVHAREIHLGLLTAQEPHLSWEAPVLKMAGSWRSITNWFLKRRLFPRRALLATVGEVTWVRLVCVLMAMFTVIISCATISLLHLGFGGRKLTLWCPPDLTCCIWWMGPEACNPVAWPGAWHISHEETRCKVCAQITARKLSQRES